MILLAAFPDFLCFQPIERLIGLGPDPPAVTLRKTMTIDLDDTAKEKLMLNLGTNT